MSETRKGFSEAKKLLFEFCRDIAEHATEEARDGLIQEMRGLKKEMAETKEVYNLLFQYMKNKKS